MLDTRPQRRSGAVDAATEAGSAGARSVAELFFTRPRAVVVYKPARRLTTPAPFETTKPAERTPAPEGSTSPASGATDRAPRVFRVDAGADAASAPVQPEPSAVPRIRRRRRPAEHRPGDVRHVVMVESPSPRAAEAVEAGETLGPSFHAPSHERGYEQVRRALDSVQQTLDAARHAREWQARLRHLIGV